MKIKSLNDLFTDLLWDIQDSEQRLVKAMPKKINAVTSPAMQKVLQDHLPETEDQLKRLKEISEMLGLKSGTETCEAMQGLLKETQEFIKRTERGPVLDAALISASQKIKHYEISAYGTLCALAHTLGYEDAARILHQTLEEEKKIDKRLSVLAEKSINTSALKRAA